MSDAETLIKPLTRATLPQEIVKALTDLIMKRVWKPGDLIPSEKELAIRFQVGRSTTRAPVKSLVVLGVLEARAGEGSFVREPTSELLSGGFRWGLLLSEGNLDDFVDVRVLIEVECARRAAANKTEELVSQLNTAIDEMRAEPMDHGAFMDSDTRFHLAIAHAARNPIFETVGSTIQSIVRIWYPKTYYIPETKGRTIAEHHAIANGVASGDMNAAGEAMRAPRCCGAALAHASAVPGKSGLAVWFHILPGHPQGPDRRKRHPACEGRRGPSAPAERRGDVGQNRLYDMRVVGDAKLVRDRQE